MSKPTSDPDLIETFVVAFYSPPGNDVNMLPGQSYQQAKIQAYTSNVFAPS